MNVTGIIAEYNPFHNGHQYQYQQTRLNSADTYIIAVMSGNFVQRGEPSIYDKYTRTRAALNAGADLILELPAAFATSSAEDFAAAATALLDHLGVVTNLCFGSECGDIARLQELAAILADEPEAYRTLLRTYLSQGLSFPRARNLALLDWCREHEDNSEKRAEWHDLLSSPNNILGLEYLKALRRRGSTITPLTITRHGQGYHDTDLTGGYASASGIRTGLEQADSLGFPELVSAQVPPSAAKLYRQAVPIFTNDCSLLLNERLLSLHRQNTPLRQFADISEELERRMGNRLLDFTSYTGRIEQLKTKQYTYTRISRALSHILLDIRTEDIAEYRRLDYAPYARVLGFRKEAIPLLNHIKQNTAVPLITKTAAARQILPEAQLRMFEHDLYCTHVYQAIQQQKSKVLPRNEYTQSVIIV